MNDETLDRDVREATEPDAEAVARLVRGALRQGQDRPQTRRSGPFVATAGAVLLLIWAVLVLNHETQKNVHAQMHVMNVGETIVVTPTSGGVWLIGADEDNADRLPVGTIIVYRSGEGR